MKTIIKITSLLGLMAAVANAQEIALKVDNMGCKACASKIIAASEKVGAVADFKADFKSKDMVIKFADNVDAAAVIEQINAIGYKAHQ